MKQLFACCSFFFLFISPVVYAQPFTDMQVGMPTLQSGAAAWADIDHDGDLDLAICGFSSTVAEMSGLFRNDNGTMVLVDSSLIKIANGAVNWGDIDLDGSPDLLMNGQHNGSALTALYHNDGSGHLSLLNSGLPPIIGVARFMDYDTDSFPDILIAGSIDDGFFDDTTILFHNNGNQTFTAVPTNLPNFLPNDIEVGDFNNDGLPDFFITGQDATTNAFSAMCRLYRNDGGGQFTRMPGGFRQIYTGTAKWGDYDHDSLPDLLYDGIDSTNAAFTLIYHNDGNGNFTELVTNLPPTGEPGSVDWADVDGDGDLDVLCSSTALLRNDGNQVFTDISPWIFAQAYPVYFADYDQDGDADILLLNSSGGQFATTIYRNDRIQTGIILPEENHIRVFSGEDPNIIHIQNSGKSMTNFVSIYASSGAVQSVFSFRSDYSFDISAFARGIYFVSIDNEEGTRHAKFLKID